LYPVKRDKIIGFVVSTCPTCGGEHPADACPTARDSQNATTAAGRATPPRRALVTSSSSGGALPSLAHEEEPPVATPVRQAAELKPGTQVGEYIVGEKLGEGGMGTVYAGVHPLIGKKVAIKLLNTGLSEDPTIVQRFVQEARAVNEIGHRNIVDIFNFGQLENGRHYYVMEFLQGRSLKKRLEAEVPLTYAEVLTVLVEVLSALQAAHDAGIVHRDLKPDNIYLVEGKNDERTVKLLDFGIAKLTRREYQVGQNQTRTGAPLGTPFYMAPEQCRSKPVDGRTDLYAMGVIMFEIFSGRLPFPGPDYIDTVNGHLSGQVPLPSDYADVPAELEALILQCLEKEADRRPQRADELRERLLTISSTLGVQLVPRASGLHTAVSSSAGLRLTPKPGATQAAVPSARRTPTPVPKKRRTGLWVGVVLLLATIGAGAAVIGMRQVHAPLAAIADYELTVESEPPGAQVRVDGRKLEAVTPTMVRIDKPEVVLRVEKDGFKGHEEVVRFKFEDHKRTVTFKLDELPSELHARTGAGPDALWSLDGSQVGSGDKLDLPFVKPGKHVLRLEAKGMQAREESLTLDPGQKSAVEWQMQPVAAPTGKKHKGASHSGLSDAPNLDFKP
jgi:serine/threonine protein kinase